MTITCPHCHETWTYQGTKENLTQADADWLDKHYDNCSKFGGNK